MSYAIAYLRYRTGEERRTPPGRFPPLNDDHPLLEEECAHCGNCFVAGDEVTLVAIGPDSLDQAAEADAGRWYSAAAFPMHQHCAWPST